RGGASLAEGRTGTSRGRSPFDLQTPVDRERRAGRVGDTAHRRRHALELEVVVELRLAPAGVEQVLDPAEDHDVVVTPLEGRDPPEREVARELGRRVHLARVVEGPPSEEVRVEVGLE